MVVNSPITEHHLQTKHQIHWNSPTCTTCTYSDRLLPATNKWIIEGLKCLPDDSRMSGQTDNLKTRVFLPSIDSDDDYHKGCWNVSHRKQQS